MPKYIITIIVQILGEVQHALLAETPNGAAAFLRNARDWLNEAIKLLEKGEKFK